MQLYSDIPQDVCLLGCDSPLDKKYQWHHEIKNGIPKLQSEGGELYTPPSAALNVSVSQLQFEMPEKYQQSWE